MSEPGSKIVVENINTPHRTERVDRVKYTAMREALLPVLPTTLPGITVAEAKSALLEHLSEDVFPGGTKAGWWLKTVQLDLEAKGLIARNPTKPMRLYRCKP
ncbi:MAG: hypothetical protein NXI27_24925 [Alphaproteobacteria bacterium]|nr:hypothetical protein [Alphaproteobacteria bacterium]